MDALGRQKGRGAGVGVAETGVRTFCWPARKETKEAVKRDRVTRQWLDSEMLRRRGALITRGGEGLGNTVRRLVLWGREDGRGTGTYGLRQALKGRAVRQAGIYWSGGRLLASKIWAAVSSR
jgi:hypothetical protein